MDRARRSRFADLIRGDPGGGGGRRPTKNSSTRGSCGAGAVAGGPSRTRENSMGFHAPAEFLPHLVARTIDYAPGRGGSRAGEEEA